MPGNGDGIAYSSLAHNYIAGGLNHEADSIKSRQETKNISGGRVPTILGRQFHTPPGRLQSEYDEAVGGRVICVSLPVEGFGVSHQ
jgi:hypothetical protein